MLITVGPNVGHPRVSLAKLLRKRCKNRPIQSYLCKAPKCMMALTAPGYFVGKGSYEQVQKQLAADFLMDRNDRLADKLLLQGEGWPLLVSRTYAGSDDFFP